MLRYDLIGLMHNAADTLDGLSPRKHPYAGGEAFALREAADNLERAFKHPELRDEFAKLYCLLPNDIERRAGKVTAS